MLLTVSEAVDSLWSDVRYAMRGLRRTPGFTAVAVIAIALGVGGTSAIYAMVDALLLRPLPLPHAEQLVKLESVDPEGHGFSFSPAGFLDFAKQTPSLQAATAFRLQQLNLLSKAGPQKVPVAIVTSGLLRTLQIRPPLGRDFGPAEDRAAAPRTAILTDATWRRRFGARADVLGETLTLDGRAHTIVGVLPRGFAFPLLQEAEVYVPAGFDEDDLKNRGAHFLQAIARLAPGATAQRATADLQVVARRLAAEHPDTDARWSARAVDLHAFIASDASEPLSLALAAALLVLLLACANVGGMLLARGAARERELAVRAALGGGRLRLVRQLLVEGALLGALGGVGGLLLGGWMLDALLSQAPPNTPRLHEIALDVRLCALAAAAAIGTGLLASAAPALQASRMASFEALRTGQGATPGKRKARARRLLVIVQLALALTLSASAALMGQSLRRAFDAQGGLDPRDVLALELSFPHDRFKKGAEASALNARLVERVAALPGVEAAATTAALPLNQGSWTIGFERADRPPPPPGERTNAGVLWVSPSYRRTLRIPLRAGRDFEPSDTQQALHVALVNEAFVRRYFPGEDPLGKRLRVGARFYADSEEFPLWQIAGVVGDVRQWGLDKEPRPEIFLPQSQQGMWKMNLLVRSALPRAQLVQAVRTELQALAPEQALGPVRSLEEVAAGSVGGRRIQAVILASAAGVGLLLAALGVYGLIAWSVAQRSGEMGIRLALGAQPGQVLRMVVVEGLRLAAVGLLLGLLGALAAGQGLRASLYGTSAADPLVYAAVAALLAGVVALASFLPARRAARTSPLEALRAE